jgi:hypothetical protein
MASDEDPIEDSQSILSISAMPLDLGVPNLAPIKVTKRTALKKQLNIPQWSIPTFMAIKLDNLQRLHQPRNKQMKDASDGFVGSERLQPDKIRKRKPLGPIKVNLKVLPLIHPRIARVTTHVSPQKSCVTLDLQDNFLAASEPLAICNNPAVEGHAPNAAYRSVLALNDEAPNSWEEDWIMPKLPPHRVWETPLSDDVFFQLAAITAPPHSE